MFSVYGMQGRLFRGSLEQLRQVGGVGALTRSRALLPTGKQGDDRLAESFGAFVESAANKATGDDGHRSALSAYTDTRDGSTVRHPLTRVSDLMSPRIISLKDSATVWQAWQVLSEQGVGQAPVIDANNHLVGLLTRADLLSPERLPSPDSHALAWRALMLQNITQIMVTPVPSVAPDSDIRRVAQVLLDTGLPGLPVVDDQGLVAGFISRSDILRAVVTDPPLDLWG
ncbi:HPP family protein [Rhodoferax sp. U11-2br]|uniref:CBS domain-containing protein n=1 Tax=Rhodoferax sp. U11-2br TaxID=2838878 RepID=UPI001BEA1009|nr:CBS domain-containing protein [Rhodoferax sp. U11-2br]MBT3067847.1 CBS domain-containing protein [Rhodoferax sp. U11-2br]